MMDAINAFDQIINDMPRSQAALDLAKQGLDSRLRTERIIKDNIAWAYINAAELGHDSDPRKTLFGTRWSSWSHRSIRCTMFWRVRPRRRSFRRGC